MGTPATNNVLRVPGRLVRDPTDLSASFPYGGTALGVVSGVALDRGIVTEELVGGDDRNQTIDLLYLREQWRLSVVLREWTDEALAVAGYNLGTGASTSKKYLANRGSVVPGRLLSSFLSMKLVYAPEDASTPGILVFRALPAIEETSMLNLNMGDDLTFSLLFHCIEGAAAYSSEGYVARLADLVSLL